MWLWGKDKTVMGPGAWSWYHIMWLFICTGSVFCFIFFFSKKHDRKLELLITRILAITFLVLEILKQIFVVIYNNGHYIIDYLPYDLCSIPIYFCLISSFIKNENNKFKTYIDNANIAICIIGGIGMMISPSYPLKTPYVLKSIHTMVWHTLLICYGLYMFFSKEKFKTFNIKFLIPISIIFTSLTLIATILNESIYYGYLVPNNLDKIEKANFFFISKHYKSPLPIMDKLYGNVPFLIYLLIYIVLFLIIVLIIKSISYLIYLLILKRKNSKNYNEKNTI